jgi:DNA-binding GntR family transcriptional regulator
MLDRSPVSSAAESKVERASFRVQARRVLRTKIITGELEAGKLYSVGEFAELLGVSATPVREALGDLEQLGLIEVIRNRGFRVPPLTDHDLDEIFQVRAMLEITALDEVILRLSAGDLAVCRELVRRCLHSAEARDLAGFLEADRDFHLTLLGTLGNVRLVEVVDRLRDQTRLYGLLSLAPERLVASAEEHAGLLEAIADRDAESARVHLRRHLEHTRGLWAGRPDRPASEAPPAAQLSASLQ